MENGTGLERKTFWNLSSRVGAPLRLHQRRLRSSKIFYPLFKFLPINRSPFVETGILDCRRRGDGQQFRPAEMVLREAVGLRVPDDRKPRYCPEATRGTLSQERR